MPNDRLNEVRATWERLAQIDPLWAVLSDPDKMGRGWGVEEFLATGVREIGNLVKDLTAAGFESFDRALDFGCGVGRLSIPLSQRFARVVGVDIAPTMVATASTLAGDRPNISFVLNDRPDLSILQSESFDLVYSNIVLQHMPPELATEYIAEFYRVVRPGGFVVFQIPSHLTDTWLPNSNDGTTLPEGAHRATIAVVGMPSTVQSGEMFDIAITVRNSSAFEWQQDLTNQLNVGNHWLEPNREVLVFDDGRARLPGRVMPNEEVRVTLRVRAPDQPGTRLLELDIVQEGVSWFADRGSATTCQEIAVRRRATDSDMSAKPAGPAADPYPTFMMRGISRSDVEALVTEHGAKVIEAREHTDQWVSYRYLTRRLK